MSMSAFSCFHRRSILVSRHRVTHASSWPGHVQGDYSGSDYVAGVKLVNTNPITRSGILSVSVLSCLILTSDRPYISGVGVGM